VLQSVLQDALQSGAACCSRVQVCVNDSSMCLCAFRINEYAQICIFNYEHMYVYIHTNIPTRISTYLYVHIHIYVCIYNSTNTYMYTNTHKYILICKYANVYINETQENC